MNRGHDRMKHRELLHATRVTLVLVTGVWIARLLWHRGHADQPDNAAVVKPRPVPSQPIPAEEPPPIEPPPSSHHRHRSSDRLRRSSCQRRP